MRNKIKQWVRNWLLKNEQIELEARLLALKQLRDNASIVALAREQLRGFDPRTISLKSVQNRNVLSLYDDLTEEEQTTLIENIHALHENPALQILMDFLTRKQVLYGQMEADTLLSLNFSRATVNGLVLLKEEIDANEGLYLDMKRTEDRFDPHEVL